MPLRRLQTLCLAHNELASISAEISSNLTSLHYLDLSFNDLTVVPLITHTLPELKTFNLADNPITAITNTSFLGVADSLEELDIRRLTLSVFEVSLRSRFRNEFCEILFEQTRNSPDYTVCRRVHSAKPPNSANCTSPRTTV